MSWDEDFLSGACAYLADASALAHDPSLEFLWSADGIYAPTPDEVPQFVDFVPSSPDALVSWSVVPLTAGDQDLAQRMVSLTATIRGARNDPFSARRIADAVRLNLHGLRQAVWGGVPVTLVWHQSAAPLGLDANGRSEWTSTFHAWAVMPSLHTTE